MSFHNNPNFDYCIVREKIVERYYSQEYNYYFFNYVELMQCIICIRWMNVLRFKFQFIFNILFQSAEDRLSCFVDIKIAKLDKLCHTSRSPQFNKCCKGIFNKKNYSFFRNGTSARFFCVLCILQPTDVEFSFRNNFTNLGSLLKVFVSAESIIKQSKRNFDFFLLESVPGQLIVIGEHALYFKGVAYSDFHFRKAGLLLYCTEVSKC